MINKTDIYLTKHHLYWKYNAAAAARIDPIFSDDRSASGIQCTHWTSQEQEVKPDPKSCNPQNGTRVMEWHIIKHGVSGYKNYQNCTFLAKINIYHNTSNIYMLLSNNVHVLEMLFIHKTMISDFIAYYTYDIPLCPEWNIPGLTWRSKPEFQAIKQETIMQSE